MYPVAAQTGAADGVGVGVVDEDEGLEEDGFGFAPQALSLKVMLPVDKSAMLETVSE